MEANRVLDFLPQQDPFRFLDKIIELDEERIVSRYTFKKDEYFYQGHFPGDPVTPGVILTEAMAQTGVVALGLYLTSLKFGEEGPISEIIMKVISVIGGLFNIIVYNNL